MDKKAYLGYLNICPNSSRIPGEIRWRKDLRNSRTFSQNTWSLKGCIRVQGGEDNELWEGDPSPPPGLPKARSLFIFNAGWLLPDGDAGQRLWGFPCVRKTIFLFTCLWQIALWIPVFLPYLSLVLSLPHPGWSVLRKPLTLALRGMLAICPWWLWQWASVLCHHHHEKNTPSWFTGPRDMCVLGQLLSWSQARSADPSCLTALWEIKHLMSGHWNSWSFDHCIMNKS
jgi:hypothetical protein